MSSEGEKEPPGTPPPFTYGNFFEGKRPSLLRPHAGRISEFPAKTDVTTPEVNRRLLEPRNFSPVQSAEKARQLHTDGRLMIRFCYGTCFKTKLLIRNKPKVNGVRVDIRRRLFPLGQLAGPLQEEEGPQVAAAAAACR